MQDDKDGEDDETGGPGDAKQHVQACVVATLTLEKGRCQERGEKGANGVGEMRRVEVGVCPAVGEQREDEDGAAGVEGPESGALNDGEEAQRPQQSGKKGQAGSGGGHGQKGQGEEGQPRQGEAVEQEAG